MSGYGAPLWPKEYGGLSGEPWQQNVVREELARYRLPTVGVNILGVGLAGPTLIAHGTEEQKARYLQKILTSEEIWCQLFSEPGAGSDLATAGTRAVRSNGEWIVNGQKVWTSIAQLSQFGMLLARTDPDDTQARRPFLLHRRHEVAGRRHPSAEADHRFVGVQRGVLHRRPDPRGEPRRRPKATAGASRARR